MAQFHLNFFFSGKSGSRDEFNKREAETSETVNRAHWMRQNIVSQRRSLRIKFADIISKKIWII
jgi:hypothetical protein